MTCLPYCLAKMGNRMTGDKINPWPISYHGTTGEQIMMDKKTINVSPYRKTCKLTYYSITQRIDK